MSNNTNNLDLNPLRLVEIIDQIGTQLCGSFNAILSNPVTQSLKDLEESLREFQTEDDSERIPDMLKDITKFKLAMVEFDQTISALRMLRLVLARNAGIHDQNEERAPLSDVADTMIAQILEDIELDGKNNN
jgi:predicted house-cleaning noncanonical NTP pyrophosphatase (MazG superfamily)